MDIKITRNEITMSIEAYNNAELVDRDGKKVYVFPIKKMCKADYLALKPVILQHILDRKPMKEFCKQYKFSNYKLKKLLNVCFGTHVVKEIYHSNGGKYKYELKKAKIQPLPEDRHIKEDKKPLLNKGKEEELDGDDLASIHFEN